MEKTLDLVLEEHVPKSLQNKLLLITSLVWAFDAAGVLVLSFTLPSIANEWKLTEMQSANILSSTFLGMLLGALSVGLISDTFGRKFSNLLYFLLTVLFTVFLGFANGPVSFALLRLVAGIGYGGLMPSVNAYLAEFMGRSLRGAYLVILEAAWAVGSIAIGLVAVLTVTNSWRISYFSFLAGLVLLPVLLRLPESPRFAFKRRGKSGVEEILGRKISDEIKPVPSSKIAVIDILRGQYLRRTLVSWTSWFVVSFVYYTLFTWAPKIFAKQGLTETRSLWFTFFMMVAQLPGYLSAAYFIEKLGRKYSLFLYFLGTGVFAIFWAFVTGTAQLITVALLLSFFTLGVWGLVYAYTPELYPTTMRATGNGMSGVVARIAGILAPQYGGYMLSRGSSLLQIFSLLALLSVVAAFTVLFFGVETKGTDIS